MSQKCTTRGLRKERTPFTRNRKSQMSERNKFRKLGVKGTKSLTAWCRRRGMSPALRHSWELFKLWRQYSPIRLSKIKRRRVERKQKTKRWRIRKRARHGSRHLHKSTKSFRNLFNLKNTKDLYRSSRMNCPSSLLNFAVWRNSPASTNCSSRPSSKAWSWAAALSLTSRMPIQAWTRSSRTC